MPKKQRNSFYFFMVDYKQEQEDLGRRFNGGLRDIQEEAGEIWKAMPSSARAKYEKHAKDYKSNGQAPKKYTSMGEPIDLVLARKQEIEDTVLQKKNTIINLVIDKKTAIEKTFFVVDVNYYCQTKDLFVINEFAIIAFNIEEGLRLVLHKILEPEIPIGYASFAKESEEEHGLKMPPLPAELEAVKDMRLILSMLMDFIQRFTTDEFGPIPLFTLEDRTQPVQSFLDQVCCDYERFCLYPLSTLFFALSQKLSNAKNEAMPQESVASIALKTDKFQYCPNLGCNFHESTEKYFNCAKSRPKRWVYTMLDYCCPLANVEMISGDHLPDDIDPLEAARVKEEREEQREQELREMKERESNKQFSFINYADLAHDERRRHMSTPKPVPVPVQAAEYSDAWPTLGGPVPRTKIPEPATGPWGKPAKLAATPSASACQPKPQTSAATSPMPAAPKRQPLRRPGCEPEGMLAQLSECVGDSIGITRGRGRGSVTSIYNN